MHLNHLGSVPTPPPFFSYPEFPQGTQSVRVAAVADGLMATISFVCWHSRGHSSSTFCSLRRVPDLHLLVMPSLLIQNSPPGSSSAIPSDWTSALHLSFDIHNDPCSLTSTLFISVSVAQLCMYAFLEQKFQLHPSSFFHIPLFLIQYQLPFCSWTQGFSSLDSDQQQQHLLETCW